MILGYLKPLAFKLGFTNTLEEYNMCVMIVGESYSVELFLFSVSTFKSVGLWVACMKWRIGIMSYLPLV